jgi:hypothetical protein
LFAIATVGQASYHKLGNVAAWSAQGVLVVMQPARPAQSRNVDPAPHRRAAMSTLTVGNVEQYQTLAAATAAASDGDVLQVQAGTYINDFAEITHSITIEGVGGMVNLFASGQIPNGKAILITDTDVTLDHIAFSGATVRDGNGAGIRYQGGNLTVTNSYFANRNHA